MAQSDANTLPERHIPRPRALEAESCDDKGPDTADLDGMLRTSALCTKSSENPLNGFKQGNGTVMFSF